MGERIVPTDRQEVDAAFIARLLLGAQSEHEQRLVAVRLLRQDDRFRAAAVAILGTFEMFDLDLVAEYARVLRRAGPREAGPREAGPREAGPREAPELEARRRQLLDQAFARAPDLERWLRHFTYGDVLGLGEVTRRLFSWSMAEMLLERSRRVGLSEYEARTSLYLALMVIDVVEILGAAGHCPDLPDVVRDVRQRIMAAAARFRPPGGGRDPEEPESRA